MKDTDREFLVWIHERLEHIHGENPRVDYMHRLKELTEAEPESTDSLPEYFRRIALLFTSRCTRTKMTKGEKTAWASVNIKEHDLVELEWFYGLDKSDQFDQTWRRVGMPATLLNNLDNQLDLAYEMKESMRKSQPKLGTAPQWD